MPSPLSITFPIAFNNHSSWNVRVLPCTVRDRAIGPHVHFEGLNIQSLTWFSPILLMNLHARVCTHEDFPQKCNLKNGFQLQWEKFSAQYKSVSEILSIDFKQSGSAAGGFWKHGEVFFSNRHVQAVIIWQILLIHFPPFQFHAWVTTFCTCLAQPKSTHSTFVREQVSKTLVICKVQVALRKSSRRGCVWDTVPIHTATFGKAQVHTVLQHSFLLCCHLILPTDPCWILLQFCKSPSARLWYSPGCFCSLRLAGSSSQGKNSFAQMSLSSRDEDDQDGGLYQPQKTHRHTSAVRWTIIQIVPVKSLLQSPLSGLRLLQVQIADAGDRETIAKTDVWSEITENSTKFSYTQWCTGCRIGENKIIF